MYLESLLAMHICRLLVITLMLVLSPLQGLAEKVCTYQTYKWNTQERKAVDYRVVKHAYSDLSRFEIDPSTGCTVCEEDQVEIQVEGLAPFKVCRLLAKKLKPVLVDLVKRKEPIFSVEGYRVGKTRGELDEMGNRIAFSNHSFGIAIDINSAVNGLYENRIQFDQNCRLIKGGEWSQGQMGSLTADSTIVKAMKSIGLQWGGEILGQQKDFMHFSPTGY